MLQLAMRTQTVNGDVLYNAADVAKKLHVRSRQKWFHTTMLNVADRSGRKQMQCFVSQQEVYEQIVRRPNIPSRFWGYNTIEEGLNIIDNYLESIGKNGHLYAFICLGGGLKVGRTRNLTQRIGTYRGWNRPLNGQILWSSPVNDLFVAEAKLKRLLNQSPNFRNEPLLGTEYFHMKLNMNDTKSYLMSLEL